MNDPKSSASDKKDSGIDPPLTDAEKKVIAVMRDVKFGKIEVVIQDGAPIRVDEIRKSIKI
ncbi:MAG: DUF2292 domain-containing protein [Clostridiales bacterium]|nr:DUF2292 domain-containing protein [Clostridiales bacterium]